MLSAVLLESKPAEAVEDGAEIEADAVPQLEAA